MAKAKAPTLAGIRKLVWRIERDADIGHYYAGAGRTGGGYCIETNLGECGYQDWAEAVHGGDSPLSAAEARAFMEAGLRAVLAMRKGAK